MSLQWKHNPGPPRLSLVDEACISVSSPSALAGFSFLNSIGGFNKTHSFQNRLIVFRWLPWMQQALQVNHPGKPLSDSYALIAYQTVPINLDAANPQIPSAWEGGILSKMFGDLTARNLRIHREGDLQWFFYWKCHLWFYSESTILLVWPSFRSSFV